MNSLLDTYSGRSETPGLGWGGVFPILNMSEDPDHLYVTAELPGVAAGNININVENDNLTIRGERKLPEADQKINFHRREREAGFFRRVISLPSKIDAGRVTAATKDGVLTVTLPKAAEAKPRTISVQTA
jgi:HSP20 family protein